MGLRATKMMKPCLASSSFLEGASRELADTVHAISEML